MSDFQTETKWVWFFGQEGRAMRGKLTDANGAVNLTQFNNGVKVQVAVKASSALLLDAAVTPDDQTTDNGADGTTGRGWFTYTIDATAAAIPARATPYLLSFVGLDGTTPHYFPCRYDGAKTFGSLRVNDPLGL